MSGGQVNVLAVMDEWIAKAALDPKRVRMDREIREARAAVAELIEAAGSALSADKWWRSNTDSPKSAMNHYMDASGHLRAALANIGAQP